MSTALDQISITGIKAYTQVGVHRWEQQLKRPIRIDLTLSCDIRAAAQSDDLSLTVDYDSLAQQLVAYAEQNSTQLLETLAERLCEVVLNIPIVKRVTLTVHKPGAIESGEVSVTLTRPNA